MIKLILALVVLAHGVGHLLFLAPTTRLADWAGQTGHSWLLSGSVGDMPTRIVGSVLWTAAISLFVAGVGGMTTSQEWWRTVTVVGAVVSAAGIVVMWDGIATSNAVMAIVFDALVVIALVFAHWPSAETLGS